MTSERKKRHLAPVNDTIDTDDLPERTKPDPKLDKAFEDLKDVMKGTK
jgi:hypothetical protein